ncbi:MAG: hypothetical protein AAGB14_00340 [Verrucomicrobiota bacterium]
MSWVTLTESDVLARLSENEKTCYEETGEESPADRLTGIILQVTALVRGKVASCDENLGKLGAAGTIPSECLWAAATIARGSLVASLPLEEGETDPRSEELKKAHAILDQVAACELRIEDPSGTIPEAADSGAGSYGGCPHMEF